MSGRCSVSDHLHQLDEELGIQEPVDAHLACGQPCCQIGGGDLCIVVVYHIKVRAGCDGEEPVDKQHRSALGRQCQCQQTLAHMGHLTVDEILYRSKVRDDGDRQSGGLELIAYLLHTRGIDAHILTSLWDMKIQNILVTNIAHPPCLCKTTSFQKNVKNPCIFDKIRV